MRGGSGSTFLILRLYLLTQSQVEGGSGQGQRGAAAGIDIQLARKWIFVKNTMEYDDLLHPAQLGRGHLDAGSPLAHIAQLSGVMTSNYKDARAKVFHRFRALNHAP